MGKLREIMNRNFSATCLSDTTSEIISNRARKIVRNNNCGVTGSKSSRKEKDRSEEEQEDLRNKRTLKISGLLLGRFWRSQEVWEIWGSQDKF
jgi:hypothetical protein